MADLSHNKTKHNFSEQHSLETLIPVYFIKRVWLNCPKGSCTTTVTSQFFSSTTS